MKDRALPSVFLSILALVILLTSGCWLDGGIDGSAVPDPAPTTTRIDIGQEVALPDLQATVRFGTVSSDSRCPENAVCVWEGNARVELRLRSDAGAETSFWLDTSSETPDPQTEFVYSGHTFTIDRLLPQPRAEVETDPANYELFLSIEPVQP